MKEYELWLILMDISNYEKVKLIEKYNNEENIYNNIDNIINKNEINKIFIKRFKHRDIYKEEDFKKFLYKNDIQYVTLSSNLYPEKLKNISNPPYMLFYKGDLSLVNEKMIAVIGARKNTLYGEQVAKMIANELFEVSYGVVSGVAAGIDSIAHRQILSRGGKTIGVLGCGIDVVYPKFNKKLYEQISKNGLLISEFLPGTKPLAYNFPQRNRIISGLAEAVVVVEAGERSGAIITANLALEQGKEIFAVPGDITKKQSIGTNKLIKDGAYIITDVNDILNNYI